jgi:hypothetical protein
LNVAFYLFHAIDDVHASAEISSGANGSLTPSMENCRKLSVTTTRCAPLVDKHIPEQARDFGISEADVIKKVILKDTVDGKCTAVDDVEYCAVSPAGILFNALADQSNIVSHGGSCDDDCGQENQRRAFCIGTAGSITRTTSFDPAARPPGVPGARLAAVSEVAIGLPVVAARDQKGRDDA